MASVKEQLTGTEFVMVDGTALVTEVVGATRSEEHCLDLMLEDMTEHEHMVAGLDFSWSQSKSDPEEALLAICTRIGCVLVMISKYSQSLRRFFGCKDITFVGVHMKDDARKLKELHKRLGIKNAVDLGELAADVLNQPRLRSVGVRRLASEVLLLPFKSRSPSMARFNWNALIKLKPDEIECVTTDAYAAYKLGKKLLGF